MATATDKTLEGEQQFTVMHEGLTGGAVHGREQQIAQEVGTFDNREDANVAARGALNTNEFASVEVSESKASGLAIVTGERSDGNEEEVFVIETRNKAAAERTSPPR